MRWARILRVGTLIALLGCGAAAAAEDALETPDRFAYVLGNSAYDVFKGQKRSGSPINLVTPQNDARGYVEVLSRLGWTILNDARVERAAETIRRELAYALNEITPGSEVLFVFNGHGFSINDTNYIVGIPASGDSYASVEEMIAGSIRLRTIVEQIASRNPSRIILVINACGDQPVMQSVGTAPAKVTFPQVSAEVLVLYSSSPRGVAYDYINTTETANAEQTGPLYSVFTRSFLKEIEQDQPLLAAFTKARIETERLSVKAASFFGKPARTNRQIPHVVYDTINGRFNLFDVSATAIEASQDVDWRLAPSSCRLNDDNVAEAIALRDGGISASDPDYDAAKTCLLQAALQDLGVDKITFDGARGGVVFSSVSADSQFEQADLVTRISAVLPSGQNDRRPLASLDVFTNMLFQIVRNDGTKIVFSRTASEENGGGSDFVRFDY